MNAYWLLGVLAIISVIAGVWAVLVVRACNKRRLQTETYGLICDMPEGVGISILCSGACDASWVERLLSDEYIYYEVIVVLDAREHSILFEELQRRYHLFRGGAIPESEVPVSGIRALYRSRNRCFRRLVLVDSCQCSAEMAWNVALTVASYDYLLPLLGREELLSGSILRLVAEVGEVDEKEKWLIRTKIGEPIVLVYREAVVSAGGFDTRWMRKIPLRCRVTLWEPMIYNNHERQTRSLFSTIAILITAGVTAVAIGGGVWWLAAVGATLLWIQTVVIYAKTWIVETVDRECRQGICRAD